ncbi:hypothetical protein Nizo2806_0667 [Lactiplantibacillus plantarum]|nr:hypothetical protein Nizo2877_1261 [Lactiplantibacillus plantarum]KTF01231.1 hypothetical protein SF2A35B_2159 [Lactiplantibacillus plantarum]KZT78626.1 hypothetical protein Nizo1838_2212 [Lactiplantibacillus plantarum]KZT80538.1 hypothetical protein Nizo1840_2532 [Lactiplantibacillus plantarum]KZT82939.1 hypothetical protein Nizo1839_0496 [Lactiplantibacillus plantarum]
MYLIFEYLSNTVTTSEGTFSRFLRGSATTNCGFDDLFGELLKSY